MPHTVKIAAVQMIACPASLSERLARAETLVVRAAQGGAQLVVLPELFNTGYEYSDENYRRAESLDGPTSTWMKQTANRYSVHIAGTFLRLDGQDIYNTLLLVAPDGRAWRYDKNYPWAWERAYFRAGNDVTVADTSLGRLGLMICWDVAHVDLWARYAGYVDAMVVCSCPPAMHDLTIIFPEGKHFKTEKADPVMRHIKRTSAGTFDPCLLRQAAHLGVPVVNTTGTGVFSSGVPSPRASLAILGLWKYIPRADAVRIETGYFNETYVANAAGQVLQRVPPEIEACALAEVTLADAPPQPRGKQPPFGISVLAYVFDVYMNRLSSLVYRRNVRRIRGRVVPGSPVYINR
jgi:predicted amidohydrolase